LAKLHENLIAIDQAGTLDGLFAARVRRSGDRCAYRSFEKDAKQWRDYSWNEMGAEVARWQVAMAGEGLANGERVAIQLRNCPDWVMFDQAAMSKGLVTVPLYTDDRPDNIAYILQEAAVRLLLVQDAGRWKRLAATISDDSCLQRVLLMDDSRAAQEMAEQDERVCVVTDWLPEQAAELQVRTGVDAKTLASIVYTSGTTGRPKGVMLSHHNMMSVAHGALTMFDCFEEDIFLSFLPLSHTLERTVGYYMPILTGSTVAYARSVAQLAADLQTLKPTLMVAVPRIFERVYGRVADQMEQKGWLAQALFNKTVSVGWRRFLYEQQRGGWSLDFLLWPLLNKLVASKVIDKLGGNMRVAMSGGAALNEEISRIFIGLGLTIVQGYGLTETAPIVSANPLENNFPASVGLPIRGVGVSIGDNDELLVNGPGVMLGYWNNHAATAQAIDADGWFHTGDQARISETGHIYITGRIKDILVLSNGEKIPPGDMESAIVLDGLFEQAMVVGEARPYMTALVVLCAEQWPAFAQEMGLDPLKPDSLKDKRVLSAVGRRVKAALKDFPGYAKIRQFSLSLEPWTVENGLITPTMKVKRVKVLERYASKVDAMYKGGPTD